MFSMWLDIKHNNIFYGGLYIFLALHFVYGEK